MSHSSPQSLGRALLARQLASLALIACAATVGLLLHLNGARAYESERRLTDIAVMQPVLIARVGPLASVLLSERATPGERLRAHSELDALLTRIETAQDALALAASSQASGGEMRAATLIDSVDAPIRTLVDDAWRLLGMSDLSAVAGAQASFTTLRETEVARVVARLEQVAELHSARQHAIAFQQRRLALMGWVAVLSASVVSAIFLMRPASVRAQALLTDAQSRADFANSLNRAHIDATARALPAADDGIPRPVLAGRVLLCVAEPALAETACDQLSAFGLDVEVMPNCDEALAAARTRTFHLFVLDAWAAAYASMLKDAAAPARVPCLVLAEKSDDARSLREAGADLVVGQPLSPRELEAAVVFVLRPGEAAGSAAA